MTQATKQVSLYERDFALWIEDTVAKLRVKNFCDLDLDNLIEEIESLGKSQRKELKSRLQTLLAHLLKRLYIGISLDYNGWERTIREQRKELGLLLEDSPSLALLLLEVVDKTYQKALKEVREDYPETQFPDAYPFPQNVDAILSQKFWE